MGLGMARAGTVSSSLPPPQGDEIEDEIPEDDEALSGEDDPADEMAKGEGYANAAEKEAMEAEAHGQGWRPLAEYRGKPGAWKTAKQFLEDGRNYLPFVQKENRVLKEQIGRMGTEMEGLRTEMTQTRKDMEKLLDFSRKANQSGYDRAVKELKDRQREAVAAGDTTTFDAIEGQLEEMADARAESVEERQEPEPQPQPNPGVTLPQEYQDFIAENPWFNTDRVLNSAMIAEHNAIIEESPGMTLFDQLEKAKEAVVARFPKKFGVAETPSPGGQPPRRPAAPLPPRNGRGASPRQDGDPIEAIADPRERAEARQGYAAAKRSMPNLSKAEFMEIFSNPHADVLDTIQRNKLRK